jgi:hypothetical protein
MPGSKQNRMRVTKDFLRHMNAGRRGQHEKKSQQQKEKLCSPRKNLQGRALK